MEIDAHIKFEALGHPKRLAVFRLLARRYPQFVPAGEIAAALGLKPNTLSAYVAHLLQTGLIQQRRQGVSIQYRVSMDQTRSLIDYFAIECGRGRSDLVEGLQVDQPMGAEIPFNVLFICSANSARSIFAECILRDLGQGRFNVYSAGAFPSGTLNHRAVALLAEKGHDTNALRSKHLSEFQGVDAPVMDFVFTVCDQAANEECPAWDGQPISGHWGVADPAKATGSDAEQNLAFQQAYGLLKNRILAFVALPFETLDRVSLQQAVDGIADDLETT